LIHLFGAAGADEAVAGAVENALHEFTAETATQVRRNIAGESVFCLNVLCHAAGSI